MLYRPSLSVTTLRVFSISAGLDASTVTPGNTAPDVSLTTPAIPLADACCAAATDGNSNVHVTTMTPKPPRVRTIGSSFCHSLTGSELPMPAMCSAVETCVTRVPEIHAVDIVGQTSCQGDSRAGADARAIAADRSGKTYTVLPM